MVVATVLAWASPALLGCGAKPPPPPPPPTSGPPSGDVQGASVEPTARFGAAPFLAFVLPAEETYLSYLLTEQGRREAGRALAVFEIRRPGPGDPPGRQAELVRRAIADRASAIIVLPGQGEKAEKALAPAIAEAEAAKVPVVAVGRVPVGYESLTTVQAGPFDEALARVIAAVQEDAEAGCIPKEASAILLVRETPEPDADARRSALEAALNKVGRPAIVVPFEATEKDAAGALRRAFQDHPQALIVLSPSDFGVVGALSVRDGQPDRRFVLAGFMTSKDWMNALKTSDLRAVVDWNGAGMVREAVDAAFRRIGGEVTPPRIEPPVRALISLEPTMTKARPEPAERSPGP